MIATISEAGGLETQNTLMFAARAKEVQNKAEVNFDIQGDVQALKQEIIELKKEISKN